MAGISRSHEAVARWRRAWALLVAAVLAATLAVAPVAEAAEPTDLQSRTQRLADALGAPGLVVAEVDLHGIVDRTAVGTTGRGESVTPESVFVWGSVSKSFTALVVRTLAHQGRITLDAPVATALPALKGSPLDSTGVTVRDLLDHTSGLPHDLTLTDRGDRRSPASDVVGEVASIEGLGPRGTYRYSSVNYLLLQALVETTTGEDFGTTIDRIVGERTGAGDVIDDPQTFADRVPPGHVPFFFTQRATEIGADTAGWGYGYLAGTPTQLARYTSWQLADHRSGAPRGPCIDTGSGGCYQSGFIHQRRQIDGRETEVIHHAGAVPGYYTRIAFSPERDRGIVVLANTYGELEATRIDSEVQALIDERVLGTRPGSTSGGMYRPVIVSLLGVVAVLVLACVWVAVRGLRGRRPRRPTQSTTVRIALVLIVGAALFVGIYVGAPTLMGAPFSTAYRWAPDATILVWTTLGGIVLLTAILVGREILWNDRGRPARDGVSTPRPGTVATESRT